MKRMFDIFFSVGLLIFLFPLFCLVAISVKIFIGSPIMFYQVRPGLNEEFFTLVKFRTMTSKTDANGDLQEDFLRLTKFGKFLRSTSLDELPELLNVLKGDMSFVGPRPLLTEYLPLYDDFQKKRHNVRPGITGWAQINGRNNISWEDRFKLDVWYVENQTFMLDLKILVKTIFKVLTRDGISSTNHVTIEKYTGIKK